MNGSITYNIYIKIFMGTDEIRTIILENNFGEKYSFNIYDRNEGPSLPSEIKNNEDNAFFCSPP